MRDGTKYLPRMGARVIGRQPDRTLAYDLHEAGCDS